MTARGDFHPAPSLGSSIPVQTSFAINLSGQVLLKLWEQKLFFKQNLDEQKINTDFFLNYIKQ